MGYQFPQWDIYEDFHFKKLRINLLAGIWHQVQTCQGVWTTQWVLMLQPACMLWRDCMMQLACTQQIYRPKPISYASRLIQLVATTSQRENTLGGSVDIATTTTKPHQRSQATYQMHDNAHQCIQKLNHFDEAEKQRLQDRIQNQPSFFRQNFSDEKKFELHYKLVDDGRELTWLHWWINQIHKVSV